MGETTVGKGNRATHLELSDGSMGNTSIHTQSYCTITCARYNLPAPMPLTCCRPLFETGQVRNYCHIHHITPPHDPILCHLQEVASLRGEHTEGGLVHVTHDTITLKVLYTYNACIDGNDNDPTANR